MIKEMGKKIDQAIKKEIGRNIQRMRRSGKNFVSAERLAEKLGKTRSAVAQIESGRNHVNAVDLWKLSRFFGCDVNEFFPKIQLSETEMAAVEKKDPDLKDFIIDLIGSHEK